MPEFSRRLAFLTIGQSPRPDLTDAIQHGLPPHVITSHIGVLDGLSRDEVEKNFSADSGKPRLISRLCDGGVVTLDAEKIGQRLQHCLGNLDDSFDIIVLLCTGAFPALRTRKAWLIEPDTIVCRTIGSLLTSAQAGIIVPLDPQIPEAEEKWAFLEQSSVFAAASPYDGNEDALIHAATSLIEQGARALVLDCMGYSSAHKQQLRQAGFTLPIMVSGNMLAGVLSEFL